MGGVVVVTGTRRQWWNMETELEHVTVHCGHVCWNASARLDLLSAGTAACTFALQQSAAPQLVQ